MSQEPKICPLKDGERLGVLNHDSVRGATIEDIRKLLPEGYALVPIEPTKSMRQIGGECNYAGISLTAACDYAYEVYKSMVNEAVKND